MSFFASANSGASTPFPTLFTNEPEAWQWPSAPIAWRHQAAPAFDAGQPCVIECQDASPIHGDLVSFDPLSRTLSCRVVAGSTAIALAFTQIRRLTLTTALRPAPPVAGAPVERVPAAAHERDYRLLSQGFREAITGRTAGH